MTYDPETLAARFLGGELGRAQRWRFERHLVDCEDCWTQVQAARTGRAALESLREVAPAHTRERVRATSELSTGTPTGDTVGGRRRRWALVPITAVAAATLVAAVIGLSIAAPPPDAQLAQVVAGYYQDSSAWAPAGDRPPVTELAGLAWVGTRSTTLDGERVLGHSYARQDGTTVLVVSSGMAFAEPEGARPVPDGDWVTEIDGLTVFCTRAPVSLIVGTDPDTVTSAARALVHAGG
jgi:hypothetical protein